LEKIAHTNTILIFSIQIANDLAMRKKIFQILDLLGQSDISLWIDGAGTDNQHISQPQICISLNGPLRTQNLDILKRTDIKEHETRIIL
ncbi:hypothetical protein ACJX0J_026168, partial [Zea mays]